MFGLEDQKKKKQIAEFLYDLEIELKEPGKLKEINKTIEKRSQRIKEILRSGADEEDFKRFGLLLQGYSAVLKVVTRAVTKKKK